MKKMHLVPVSTMKHPDDIAVKKIHSNLLTYRKRPEKIDLKMTEKLRK